jgi:hypothetical protein
MTAIDREGRTLHHGGAGRTIGQIYRDGRRDAQLRQGFRSRAEIEAEAYRDGWPVIEVAAASTARLAEAARYQRDSAMHYAEAFIAQSMAMLAPESSANLWTKLAGEYRDDWWRAMRLGERYARTARMLMGIED